MEIKPSTNSVLEHVQSLQKHKHQTFTQIYLPVALSVLLFLALFLLILLQGGKSAPGFGQLGSVATIILILISASLGIILLAVLVGAIYGIAKLSSVLPRFSLQALAFFHQARQLLTKVADGVASPFLALHQFFAEFRRIGQSLLNRFSTKGH